MALFYAPAFFAHLLGHCLASPRPVLGVARLGVAVIGTMLLVWAPLLRDPGPLAVAARLAPIGRGVFEDFVASLWCANRFVMLPFFKLRLHVHSPCAASLLSVHDCRCATSPVFKWKTRFAAPTLARAAAALSLAACAPSVAHQILRPSRAGLLYGMLNASFAAFLLGFQVHEKSILLPLLPAALLALDEPRLLRLFGPLAAFSMYPLLRFERLGGAYAACMGVLCVLGTLPAGGDAGTSAPRRGLPGAVWVAWGALAAAGAAALHAAYALPAPPALPHLHAAGVSAFSAAHFVALAAYANVRQWQLPAEPAERAPPGRPLRASSRRKTS
jgi:alpha-1,3-glucosyltransferase